MQLVSIETAEEQLEVTSLLRRNTSKSNLIGVCNFSNDYNSTSVSGVPFPKVITRGIFGQAAHTITRPTGGCGRPPVVIHWNTPTGGTANQVNRMVCIVSLSCPATIHSTGATMTSGTTPAASFGLLISFAKRETCHEKSSLVHV